MVTCDLELESRDSRRHRVVGEAVGRDLQLGLEGQEVVLRLSVCHERSARAACGFQD